MSNRYLLNLHY